MESTTPISSPPPSPPVPEAPPPDARDRLHALAQQLIRIRDAQLLRDYLRLRASLR